jgi:hypothetical protein
MDVDFPKLFSVFDHSSWIHVHDDALSSKSLGSLPYEIRILAGDGIKRNFIATGLQQVANILNGSYPTPDSQRHKHLIGRATHHIDHDRTLFVTGRDVKKDQLVSTFKLISSGDLHRIPSIAQLDKVGSLDHPSSMHIQTWNNAFGKHDSTTAMLMHQALKLIEQVRAIVRPSRSLRVILHTKSGQLLVPDSRDRIVVQVPMSDL